MIKPIDAGRYLVILGCLYEAFAVPHRTPVPTITTILHRAQRHRAGRVVCVAWLAIWVHHFVRPEHYR